MEAFGIILGGAIVAGLLLAGSWIGRVLALPSR
jgi:hypothetical protein